MEISFRKVEETFTFYDGASNKIERLTEIRFDPLTNETSRIVFDPNLKITPPDYQKESLATKGVNCPFCPENIFKLTPLFPTSIEETGRIIQGEAIVFPNLFPYSKHNGVIAICHEHYVKLEDFSETVIKDAFLAASTYIQKVCAEDKDVKYASINWNYLPNSGGSILHPHIHTIISETATNYQQKIIDHLGGNEGYFTNLCETEKRLGERFIGEVGCVAWMHAYAPKSHNDFIAIFQNKSSIFDVTEQDWLDFAISLKNIFAVLMEQGLASFNMVMNISPLQNDHCIHVRFIPRLTLGQLGTSDINFFQSLHLEPLSYKKPEDIAQLARKYF